MSSVTASVEWVFGDIINYFSFRDFKKKIEAKYKYSGKNVHCLRPFNQCQKLFISNINQQFFQVKDTNITRVLFLENTRVYMYRTVYFVYASNVKTKHSHCSDLFCFFLLY